MMVGGILFMGNGVWLLFGRVLLCGLVLLLCGGEVLVW